MTAPFRRLNEPERVLVTKIGLDGHDRGSRVVASYLREAGMEVAYTPPWQTIGDVVALAKRGEVDVIGVSSLATDHLIVPDLMAALRAAGLDHVAVIVGGIVEGFRIRAAALRWRPVGRSARVGKPLEEETAGSCRGVAMGKAGLGGWCCGAVAAWRGAADGILRLSCWRWRVRLVIDRGLLAPRQAARR